MRVQTFFVAGLIAAGLGVSSLALAHSGATGIVKERMDTMSDVGRQMKAIAAIMKGDVDFNGEKVAASASTIAAHARKIPELFPHGTNPKPSEALDVIWTDWERFSQIATEMEKAAAHLAESAKTATSPSDIRAELVAVGKSCKACHADFRLAK